jgi:hypothetical protein
MLLLVMGSMFALRLSLTTIIGIGAVLMLLAGLESATESGRPVGPEVKAPPASSRRR